MIRPLTVATFLIACGSGLYLYQSKHEVQLLDRTIEKTVHDTNALREQSRLLAAEWTMLNDPERLRQFSDTYLSLKTISPAQFTSLADLDARLPPPQVEMPSPNAEEEPAVVEPELRPIPEPAATAPEKDTLPVPPAPVTRPGLVARAGENKPSPVKQPAPEVPGRQLAVAEPRLPESRSPEPRQVDQRPSEQRAAPRMAEARPEGRTPSVLRPIALAAPRPRPLAPPADIPPGPVPYRLTGGPAAPQPAVTGSLLGMARGSMPPAPRPTPVSATYNAN